MRLASWDGLIWRCTNVMLGGVRKLAEFGFPKTLQFTHAHQNPVVSCTGSLAQSKNSNSTALI